MSQTSNGRHQVAFLQIGQRFYTAGGDIVRLLNFQSGGVAEVVFESGPHKGLRDTVSQLAYVVPVRD